MRIRRNVPRFMLLKLMSALDRADDYSCPYPFHTHWQSPVLQQGLPHFVRVTIALQGLHTVPDPLSLLILDPLSILRTYLQGSDRPLVVITVDTQAVAAALHLPVHQQNVALTFGAFAEINNPAKAIDSLVQSAISQLVLHQAQGSLLLDECAAAFGWDDSLALAQEQLQALLAKDQQGEASREALVKTLAQPLLPVAAE
jgi:hypothetical protein